MTIERRSISLGITTTIIIITLYGYKSLRRRLRRRRLPEIALGTRRRRRRFNTIIITIGARIRCEISQENRLRNVKEKQKQ